MPFPFSSSNSIIEDENGNGIYESEEDILNQEMVLDSWEDISYVNLNAHIFTIKTTDDYFLARIFAVEGYTDVNGTIIAPAEIKVDLEIHSFPFITETSLLALKTRFQTNALFRIKDKTRGEEEGYVENENSIEFESDSAVGYFAWADNAVADGVEVGVLSSPVILGASEKFMFLNYPHATDIIHDPKIGFVSDISSGSISGFPLVMAFSAIGIASLFLMIRKRK